MPNFLPDPVWRGPGKNVLEITDEIGLKRLAEVLRKQSNIILDTEYAVGTEDLVSMQFGAQTEKGFQYFYFPIGAKDPVSGRLTHELARGFSSADEALAAQKAHFAGIAGKGKSWIMHNFGADARWLHKMGIGLDPFKDNIQDTMYAMYREGLRSASLKEYAKESLGMKGTSIIDLMMKERHTTPYLSRARLSRYAVKDILYTGEAFHRLGAEKDAKVLELLRKLQARQLQGITDPIRDIEATLGYTPAAQRTQAAENFLQAIAGLEEAGGGAIRQELYRDWEGFQRFTGQIADIAAKDAVTGRTGAAVSQARGAYTAWGRASQALKGHKFKDVMGEVRGILHDIVGITDRRVAAGDWLKTVHELGQGSRAARLGLSTYELDLMSETLNTAEMPIYMRYPIRMAGGLEETGKHVKAQLAKGAERIASVQRTGTIGFSPNIKRLLPPEELSRVEGAMHELLRTEFRKAMEYGQDLPGMVKRGEVTWKELIPHLGLREAYEPWSFAYDKTIAQGFDDAIAEISKLESAGKLTEQAANIRRGEVVQNIIQKQVYEPVGKEILSAVKEYQEIHKQYGAGLIDDVALAARQRELEDMFVISMTSRPPSGGVPSIGTWFSKETSTALMDRLNQIIGGTSKGAPQYFDVSDLGPLLEGQTAGRIKGYMLVGDKFEHVSDWFAPRGIYEKLAANKEVNTLTSYMSSLAKGKPSLGGSRGYTNLGIIRSVQRAFSHADQPFEFTRISRAGEGSQRTMQFRGTLPIFGRRAAGVQTASQGLEELRGLFESKVGHTIAQAAPGEFEQFVSSMSSQGVSSLDDLHMLSKASGKAAIPLAAAGLILGVGLVHMLRRRRSDEAWASPSPIWGKYTQPGQAMQEEDLTPAGFDMGPPPKQSPRLEREQVWDTRDLVFAMNYNRTRHWNMDQAKHSSLYGGMTGRL